MAKTEPKTAFRFIGEKNKTIQHLNNLQSEEINELQIGLKLSKGEMDQVPRNKETKKTHPPPHPPLPPPFPPPHPIPPAQYQEKLINAFSDMKAQEIISEIQEKEKMNTMSSATPRIILTAVQGRKTSQILSLPDSGATTSAASTFLAAKAHQRRGGPGAT